MSNGSLAHLPAHQLEDPLNGVLVESQKSGDRSATKGRLSLDRSLNWIGNAFLHLRLRFNGLVVHRASRNIEPTTELRHRNGEPVFSQAPLDLKDHFSSFLPCRAFDFLWARHSNIASPYVSSSVLSCDSYCSRMSSGLAYRAFYIPDLAWSIQDSISEGGRSNCRDDSFTVVFP